jgi:hypothetical protein
MNHEGFGYFFNLSLKKITIVNVRRKLALYDRHSLAKSPLPPFEKEGRRGDFMGRLLEDADCAVQCQLF